MKSLILSAQPLDVFSSVDNVLSFDVAELAKSSVGSKRDV